jgi:hypothetical protein
MQEGPLDAPGARLSKWTTGCDRADGGRFTVLDRPSTTATSAESMRLPRSGSWVARPGTGAETAASESARSASLDKTIAVLISGVSTART